MIDFRLTSNYVSRIWVSILRMGVHVGALRANLG